MKQLTQEWVRKAEADFATAGRELRARKVPNYDAACFHAQQCAEKYLKARLQEAGVRFGKTHNLSELLNRLLKIEPEWELFRPDARRLTLYAVEFRYPGKSADKGVAREAIQQCAGFRKIVREALGLKIPRARKRPPRKARQAKPRARSRRKWR